MSALVPPHVHTLEDEYSIVLDGQIGFRSNDQEVVLGPGGYIIKPRGEVHAMWNAGSTRARMIEVITPAGFERFFREFADMTDAGPPDFAEVAELAALYALTILIFAMTCSNAAVSALVMSFLIPTNLLSAMAGVVIDRLRCPLRVDRAEEYDTNTSYVLDKRVVPAHSLGGNHSYRQL